MRIEITTKTSNGLEYRVRELTTAEIRKLISFDSSAPFDTVSNLLFDDVSFDDIVAATSIEKDKLDELLPSELREIADKVKEANPHFFAMRARVKAAVQKLAPPPQSAA